MDLILRQARLQSGETIDIGITDGQIVAINPQLTEQSSLELDAAGRLTIPAFVNGQLHACKSFWRRLVDQLPPETQQMPRFEVAKHVKRLYTADDVFDRVDEVIRLAIANGTCAIRLFGDVDADSGLNAVEGLLRIRQKYNSVMKVEVVAFPQDGFEDGKTLPLIRSALKLGVDIVGGIPWIEPTKMLQHRHTQLCFALAQEFDCDLHFVCDDVIDPSVRSLEDVARQTIAYNYMGRVSVTQCAALASYTDSYAAEVIQLVKQAEMTIFCNSHVSLIATEFDQQQPWPRGITRVRELLDANISVACAQDDIDNWFYPLGRNDMLEVAQFMVHTGKFAWQGETEHVLPMVTTIPAEVLRMEKHGLYIGAEANLVVLDAINWHEAIQFQANKRYVVLQGQLVASNERQTEIYI
ncbi:amidohydrolase family protein [Chloroflexi bacterium TSY]|nr:amidohydrolase family protein [Chloroflexi bacterium TSY]